MKTNRWVEIASFNDVNTIDAVIELIEKNFLFLAGFQFELSEDMRFFRLLEHGMDLSDYYHKDEVDKDKWYAEKLNLL